MGAAGAFVPPLADDVTVGDDYRPDDGVWTRGAASSLG